MNVRRILGQIGSERGRENEERVLRVLMESKEELSPWFASARLGTREEDRDGVDIVVETYDLGPLFLQVKSSRAGERKFYERRRSKLIGMVVLNGGLNRSFIFRRVNTALQELRTALQRKRG